MRTGSRLWRFARLLVQRRGTPTLAIDSPYVDGLRLYVDNLVLDARPTSDSSPTDVLFSQYPNTPTFIAQELVDTLTDQHPELNAFAVRAAAAERSVFASVDWWGIVVWVHNTLVLPVVASMIASYLYAITRRESAPPEKMRFTVVVDHEGTFRKIQFEGTPDAIARQLERFPSSRLLKRLKRLK